MMDEPELHDENEVSTTRAVMTRAEAAEWLERQESADWGPDAQQVFEAWLGKSWAHAVAYWRLEAAWKRADRLGALREPGIRKPTLMARSWPWSILMSAAAGVTMLLVLGVGWAAWNSGVTAKTYSTAVGGRELLTLADGSQIELNTNTTIRVGVGSTDRRVWLDKGEAYFEIKHDRAHPFVVNTGTQRIVDLGTKFTARLSGGRTEVALLEGLAKLETVGDAAKSVVLTPGDVATATPNRVSVIRSSPQDIADQLGWQRGMLVFRHTALADAVAAFNRYNDEKIVIADPAVGRLTVNGTFPTTGIALFNRAAKEAFGLRVEKKQGNSVLSR